jgi:hypothetical protein
MISRSRQHDAEELMDGTGMLGRAVSHGEQVISDSLTRAAMNITATKEDAVEKPYRKVVSRSIVRHLIPTGSAVRF